MSQLQRQACQPELLSPAATKDSNSLLFDKNNLTSKAANKCNNCDMDNFSFTLNIEKRR